ncbi:MAG TPA: S41 family peptidase [Candidatus Kapabacteria bacterium]
MKTNLIPIALTVIVAYSCSPYERSHIVMREISRANAITSEREIAPYPTYKYNSLLNEVLMTINNHYLEHFTYDPAHDTSLSVVLSKLDQYSYYMKDEEMNNRDKRFQFVERTDLGLYLHSVNDTAVITSIMPYSFAHEKGLLPGDRLFSVDTQSVVGANIDSLANELSYAHNTTTTLGIFRPSEGKSYYITTKSNSRQIRPTVFERMLTDTIGYMKITSFGDKTYEEACSTLSNLSRYGMKRLVFDLRGNAGGALEETMRITKLFFDERSPILALRSALHPENGKNYYSEDGAPYAALPIVLLVDGFSASASEIIAGVFQDKERALIVGLPTFGKGVVQSPFRLSPGNGWLSLTTSRIYTPSGRCVHMADKERERLEDILSIDTFITNMDHSYERSFVRETKNFFLTSKDRRVYESVGVIPDYIVPQYSSAATRIFLWADPVYDAINDIIREKFPRTYIDLPTPTAFYKHFGQTKAAEYVKEVLQNSPVEIDDMYGTINVKEVMSTVALHYSMKVNSYWAYTREALLDDRQVQFALTLLQPKQEPVTNPVIKKVNKSKRVKRGAKS